MTAPTDDDANTPLTAAPRVTLTLRGHWLTPDLRRPLLVVGPSLGTGVVALWDDCAQEMSDRTEVDVLGWDLPGHGDGDPVDERFTLEDIASAVVTLVDQARPGADFIHAGVSVAGGVSLALAVGRALVERGQQPARVRAVAMICSGATFGTPQGWAERAELVRRAGTPVMVEASAQRWFAPGFIERSPRRATSLLTTLQHADKDSYARVCEALSVADFRADLPSIEVPVMVMGGRHDPVFDPGSQEQVAAAIPRSTLVTVEDAAHLAPAERPAEVGEVLARWIGGLR